MAFSVLRPGKPVEEFTVAGTQFKEFLFDYAAILAERLGGKISGENRTLWVLGRPSTIIELLEAGKLLIADLAVRQRSRLALELWSKDQEFSLPFLLVEGEVEQDYRAKLLDAFRRDCGNAALCLRLFSTVRENKGYEPYALQYARRACELSPGYGRAHIAAALATNSDVDAMRHFELAYRLLPGSLYAIRHYLTTLVKADRPVQELTEVVRQGININPYDPDNYRSLIDTFVELKKYRHALEIAKGLQQLFEPEINPRTRTCLERNPKVRHLMQVGGTTRFTRSGLCSGSCEKRRNLGGERAFQYWELPFPIFSYGGSLRLTLPDCGQQGGNPVESCRDCPYNAARCIAAIRLDGACERSTPHGIS